MADMLNISLSEEQKGWLNSRREAGGFASISDVIRDPIHRRQEKDRAERLERFSNLIAMVRMSRNRRKQF